jgi:23S rRNA (adenine2503-C2)-methyltransferase
MDESIHINLALSLNEKNDDIRKRIMPIANKYRLSDILKSIERYYKKTNRRITFEYCLIKEINDSDKNAYELVQLFKDNFKNTHVDFNINIIPVNVVKENSFERPDTAAILNFKNILEKNNISVTIRRELGKDISGSCGQLRASVK